MTFTFIREDTSPLLVFAGQRFPLPWHEGAINTLQQKSRFVRLNSRGVLFAGGTEPMNSLRTLLSQNWNELSCSVSKRALCEGTNITLFPNNRADIPFQENIAQYDNNDFFKKDGKVCSGQSWAGGHLTGAGRYVDGNDTTYEITVCDLFDSGLDVVWQPYTGYVHWRYDTRGTAAYIFLSIAAIFFAAVLCGNMAAVLENKKISAGFAHLGVFATLVVLFVLDGWSPVALVTDNDIFAWQVLLLYVFIQCLFQLFSDCYDGFFREGNSVGLSIFTGILLLLATAAHNSFDNPYQAPLVTLFGIRTWWKQLQGMSGFLSPHEFTLLVIYDGLVYCLILSSAFAGLELSIFPCIFISFFTGFFLLLKTV